MTPLRIAYVAMHWDYGDPRRGVSFEEMTFRSALEGMGHIVYPYDFMERYQRVGREAMNAELVSFIRDLKPDLAFFFLFLDEIDFNSIRSLTDAGIVTVNWFADDHTRFDSFSRQFAPALSFAITTDPDAIPKYEAMGYRKAILSQWACNTYAYGVRATEPRYDITFVGQCYGARPKTIKALRKAGFDVRCWGRGWENGRLEHQEMLEVFGASRINLNLSGAWTGTRWRRRPAVGQIKGRTFEVPGSGGFLLTERVDHLETYFRVGHEVAVFDGIDDLLARAHYWLEHDDERRGVARAGHERVLAEHTYDHRFAAIFAAMGFWGATGDSGPRLTR